MARVLLNCYAGGLDQV